MCKNARARSASATSPTKHLLYTSLIFFSVRFWPTLSHDAAARSMLARCPRSSCAPEHATNAPETVNTSRGYGHPSTMHRPVTLLCENAKKKYARSRLVSYNGYWRCAPALVV
ncbi:hypothetical protein VTJ04DRAFT_2510 [Mycothermus thermophilus]|uniref:uncharacterized protein n=1 Tax=Humicola insolens TaxID=85995 RepID=UPI0037421392